MESRSEATTGMERSGRSGTRAPVAFRVESVAAAPVASRLLRRDVDRLARFFRVPRGRRLPRALMPERVGALAARMPRGVDDPALRVLLQRIDGSPILDGNRVQFFFGARGAFDAMRRAIEDARHEILVEFYVLADEAGQRLADLLVAAAGRGVAVRVLADASHRRRETPFWQPLRDAGVDLKLFQPFFKPPGYRPPRDHRKILVVDRRIAFTGGRDSRSTPAGAGPVPALRDLYARVEGRTAMEMAVVFSDGWDRARGTELVFAAADVPDRHEDGASILVLDSPSWRVGHETASVMTAIVEGARRRLRISNPRFAPKPFVVETLGRAAERGVDVQILVPQRGDIPIARSASRGSYRELLRRGVRIREFPGDGLQAKLLIADDVAVIGSTNLDFRYFHMNAQCNLVVLERATAATLAAAFDQDAARARPVTLESLARLPLLHRLADGFARELLTAL
jgi:cardiolipin synthase A/B